MKKKVILLGICLLGIYSFVGAQVNHNLWSGCFSVRGNSLLSPMTVDMVRGFFVGYEAGDVDKALDNSMFDPYSNSTRWFSFTEEFDFHIPNWRMEGAELQGPYWWRVLLFGDFRHDYNFSLGYTLRWRSLDVPIGARFGLNYEWRGLSVMDGPLTGLHRTSGIVPSAGLNWRMLGLDFEREHGWNLMLDGGVSYVKVLTYNDPCALGSDAAQSGWRGSVALGVIVGRNSLSLRYEWDSYDYLGTAAGKTHLQNLVLSIGAML